MKYKILKDFKGSPEGFTVIQYTKGETVELTDSLAEAVLAEGWVEAFKKKDKNTRKRKGK